MTPESMCAEALASINDRLCIARMRELHFMTEHIDCDLLQQPVSV